MTIAVTTIGTVNSAGLVDTWSITVPSGGVPAGSHIVILWNLGTTSNTTAGGGSITDSASQAYTEFFSQDINSVTTNGTLAVCVKFATAALISGNTISASWNAGLTGQARVIAMYVSGTAPALSIDVDHSSGSSAAPSVSIPNALAGQLLLTSVAWLGNSAFTQDSTHAWNNLPTGTVSDATAGISGGYIIQGGSSTPSPYAPTLGTSVPWATGTMTFPVSLPCSGQELLLGVGCWLGWTPALLRSPIPILGGVAMKRWGALRGRRTVSRRDVLIGHNGGPPLED